MAEHEPHSQRSAGRPGRRFGPLRADTEEYRAVAEFLRNRVREAGLTVQGLTEATGLGKSAISERLAGDKLDEDFVAAVVTACTEAVELRPRRGRLLSEGAALLARAERLRTPVLDVTRERNPALRNLAVAAQQRLLELHEELHVKNGQLAALTRVRHQSELALREATGLASVLSVWVMVLADEVEHLTRERELTMSVVPPDLARLRGVDAELARTVERHARADAELTRTEQDRRLAAALLAEAMTRTRAIRREVLPLQAAVRPEVADGTKDSPVTADLTPQAVYDDTVDAALERAEAVSRAIAERLRGAVTDLDEEAQTLAPAPADSADNPPTGPDTADNTLWWDMLGDVPTTAFAHAEETAVALLARRDPHDPEFEEIVRTRGPREVMLLADRLLAHHWAEGSVRLRAALSLGLPPAELAHLVLALAKIPGSMRRSEQGAQMLLAAVLLRPPADVLALTDQLGMVGDELPRVVRHGVEAFVRRPQADVVAYLRDGQGHRASPPYVLEAVVREWPADRVLALLDLDDGQGESVFAWLLLAALPRPPFAQTELLLHLWTRLPHGHFMEMMPVLYDGDWKEMATVIARLHHDWPPPLDRAARELAAEVMPLVIRRESLARLDLIADALTGEGLSPEEIFAPYKHLLTPEFMTPPDGT